jgi:hypothetical protein
MRGKDSAEHTWAARQIWFSIIGNSFCSFSADMQSTSRGVHGSKKKKKFSRGHNSSAAFENIVYSKYSYDYFLKYFIFVNILK